MTARPVKMLRPVVQAAVRMLSRDRMLGEDLGQVAGVVQGLRAHGYETTVGYWNEVGEPPESVIAKYKLALDMVRTDVGVGYLSIKAPAFKCDPRLFAEIVEAATRQDVPLHFDALGHDAVDETLTLLRETEPSGRVGFTLPGRWRRSLTDADALHDLDVPVRVVKGEWEDPGAPERDAAVGFLEVVRQLSGRRGPVRVATHDVALARASAGILRGSGTPCELEVLYGFPVRRLLPALFHIGCPVRIYVPFGHGWLPYCVDHVRRRPALLWWLFRDSAAGNYRAGFVDVRACRGDDGGG
jgi:proline dehydrogenase